MRSKYCLHIWNINVCNFIIFFLIFGLFNNRVCYPDSVFKHPQNSDIFFKCLYLQQRYTSLIKNTSNLEQCHQIFKEQYNKVSPILAPVDFFLMLSFSMNLYVLHSLTPSLSSKVSPNLTSLKKITFSEA